MKIVSWNVNGLRAVLRKDALRPVVDELAPDVLCLQEIKAQETDVELAVPGYQMVWNSAARKGYSGTAMLFRKPPIRVFAGLLDDVQAAFPMGSDPFGDPGTEGRVLTAECDDVFVVTVYTPNAKDDLGRLPLRHRQWDPAFLLHCRLLESEKPVIFCGDLNVAHTELDLARPKPNRGKKGFTDEERSGFQAFLDAGFLDSFRLFHSEGGHYTWWSQTSKSRENNVGWRIDYILASSSLRTRVKAASIHASFLGSDHCPVSLELGT